MIGMDITGAIITALRCASVSGMEASAVFIASLGTMNGDNITAMAMELKFVIKTGMERIVICGACPETVLSRDTIHVLVMVLSIVTRGGMERIVQDTACHRTINTVITHVTTMGQRFVHFFGMVEIAIRFVSRGIFLNIMTVIIKRV